MHCPINASTTHTDIIYGSADDYVNPTAFPTVGNISAHKLTAADHFFGGQYDALQATLEHILTADNLGKRD
jgi:alpha/beta superfamily hydrolase